MVASRIEARAVFKVMAIVAGRGRRRRAAQPRDRRGQDDDPLGLRGALPRPRAEPAGRPGPARPASGGRHAAALAGDPDRLRRSSWSRFIFLVLTVIPPIVREVEAARLAAAHLRQATSRTGRTTTSEFQRAERQVRHHRSCSRTRPRSCRRSSATRPAPRRRSRSGSSTTSSRRSSCSRSTFFLLLDGGQPVHGADRAHPRARSASACAASGSGSPQIVRSYVSVNLLLAALAGMFTWLALELLGVELAVPLAVLVALPRPRPADRVHRRRPAGGDRRRPATTSPTRC